MVSSTTNSQPVGSRTIPHEPSPTEWKIGNGLYKVTVCILVVLCFPILAITGIIYLLAHKVSSIFSRSVKENGKKEAPPSQVKLVRSGVAENYNKVESASMDLFKKACSEGKVEEAEKFFDLLGLQALIVGRGGFAFEPHPLAKGLIATFVDDPATKSNRLLLAEKLIDRDPEMLREPYAVVYALLNLKDPMEFLPLLMRKGLNVNSEVSLRLLLVYAINHGRLEMLDWLFKNPEVKINENTLSFSLGWLIADQIRNPKREYSLDVCIAIGDLLLKKGKETGSKCTLYHASLYASPPVRDPEMNSGPKAIAQAETDELNNVGFTIDFVNRIIPVPVERRPRKTN